ncbi:adenylate cyclase type 2-like, partial [Asbolus verrucosus]
SELNDIIPDLVLYGIVCIFSMILLIVTDNYVKQHPYLLKIFAGAAFVTIFFINAFIPFFYRNKQDYANLRPAYTTYLIISNYIFLNIHNNLVALVLGLFVSIFHIVTLILVTYDNTGKLYQRLGSDAIYLICINGLGIYFRYMNEIVIRRSFLDRRSCVESTYQLKFEEEQENHLMSSIIPQHIIVQVKKAITEYWNDDNVEIAKHKPFEDLYVEEHPHVSILFADIVNYTAMTTRLDVTDLLEVLNELFSRFDEASEKLNVLRIKFLGDCYYCVAGLPPDPAPNHAEACVDLGLKMISIIADIRERKNLNINMRIGIHSGKISSGIIGSIKWQYDIWSRDVDIANKMETEGTAGMVHITKTTKELLTKSYNISLSKKTRRFSGNPGLTYFQRRPSANSRISTANDRKRRTAFMNNNIKRYKERLADTNKELEDTIENMLLSKFEQWFHVHDMYRILLVFKNFKSELDFIKMPDPLFKYYLLSEILLVILVFIIENLTLSTWDWPPWPFYLTIGIIVLFFLPLCWTYHLWSRYIAKFENDAPKNKIICFLFNTSKFITNNVAARIVIYTILYGLFCLCVLTEWHMTETCGLAIIMSFLFLRMYMWLKLLYAATIAVVYSWCILQYSGGFYGASQTYNYLLKPQISHIMAVVFLTVMLHLVDRQTEYMNRLDHLWYKNLIEKEKKANDMHAVNTMLLKNILPLHVAELYLNVTRHSSEEVYHENYEDAAVMFASIMNFSVNDMGQGFLKIMSAIISEFDMLLVGNTFGRPIEKIKIAKWTYMAACGLAPGLGNAENIRKDQCNHVVISLLKFAASLMQKLKSINKEIPGFEMKLRIGISYGRIAAGVVGSKKPLYDIWGDPVNMASRMDTTGLPNHIQVLKPTAEIIEAFGYVCKYRGEIRVKGRENLVSTYFVELDENFNLKTRDA